MDLNYKTLKDMLENPKVNIKIKLASLWASATFCYLYGDYFELYTPGKINSLLTGENILDSPTKFIYNGGTFNYLKTKNKSCS